jgi:hypothetical protein
LLLLFAFDFQFHSKWNLQDDLVLTFYFYLEKVICGYWWLLRGQWCLTQLTADKCWSL